MAGNKRALFAVVNAQQTLFSSTDSFVEDILLPLVCSHKNKKRTKVYGYVDLIAHCYTDQDFKMHFRMYRSTAEELVLTLGRLAVVAPTGRPQFPLKHQCLMVLWVMANQESYRSVADRFGVSKGTVFYTLRRICSLLVLLSRTVIAWPSNQQAEQIMTRIQVATSYPGTIGMIDGTHISILPPTGNSAAYINRKGFPSMIVQAVCDDKCKFTHVFIGYPGSVHDARVYNLSGLMSWDDSKFSRDSHLVGDAAYPIGPHLLTPYRDNGHLNAKQRKYNVVHAKTRVTIERAFGMLKSRWRRMRYLEMHCSVLLPKVILAACVLHNWCLSKEDMIDVIEPDDQFGLRCSMNPNCTRLRLLGTAKRTSITNTL